MGRDTYVAHMWRRTNAARIVYLLFLLNWSCQSLLAGHHFSFLPLLRSPLLILQQSHTYPVEVLSSQIEARRVILSAAHHQSVTDSRDALIPL